MSLFAGVSSAPAGGSGEKRAVEFRRNALTRLQSPEELDLPVRLARPQGCLVLAVTLAVLAAAAVWAVTGTVSSKLNAPGVLTSAQGGYVLQSPLAGQVVEVGAQEGQTLPTGSPLLQVRTSRGVQPVRMVAQGRIITLTAKIGAVVGAGTDVATVEHVSGAKDPLVAMLYVSGDGATSVPVGAVVDLTVQSVPAERFGTLRGRVEAIGGEPQTRQQITAFLGDERLGEVFSAKGAPTAVVVRLDPDAGAASGYRWSASGGPPSALTSMTPVGGTVALSAQRPLDWLLP
jgi:biotin carboxyl carrier protein